MAYPVPSMTFLQPSSNMPTLFAQKKYHLGGGVICTFLFQTTAIVQVLITAFVGITALRKGPQSFFLSALP